MISFYEWISLSEKGYKKLKGKMSKYAAIALKHYKNCFKKLK